jgi:hypothetical protein
MKIFWPAPFWQIKFHNALIRLYRAADTFSFTTFSLVILIFNWLSRVAPNYGHRHYRVAKTSTVTYRYQADHQTHIIPRRFMLVSTASFYEMRHSITSFQSNSFREREAEAGATSASYLFTHLPPMSRIWGF